MLRGEIALESLAAEWALPFFKHHTVYKKVVVLVRKGAPYGPCVRFLDGRNKDCSLEFFGHHSEVVQGVRGIPAGDGAGSRDIAISGRDLAILCYSPWASQGVLGLRFRPKRRISVVDGIISPDFLWASQRIMSVLICCGLVFVGFANNLTSEDLV